MKNHYSPALFTAVLLIGSCGTPNGGGPVEKVLIDTLQGSTLFGEPLVSRQLDPVKDSARIADFLQAERVYMENRDDPDALIWCGRRTAYLGDYQSAIEIFTDGTEKFPDDARFYRHRGHRYITLREFGKAIGDLQHAARLIEGKPDEIEPDGIPNARNTPVSSLNTNIWYHLGLAYYLDGDMENALAAFSDCLKASTNPDMLTATSNWLYMISRRMGNIEMAAQIVEPITAEMDVFENMAYHKLLLFYKGVLSEDDLRSQGDGVDYMNDAIAYGVGNWYFYNGDTAKAVDIFTKILESGNPYSFATLAAEADMYRLKSR